MIEYTQFFLAAAKSGPDVWDALISLGLLVSITLLVSSLFGQAGQVQLSPQRAAALATGHTDRKTIFENPYLRPILWMLLSAAHRLAMPRAKAWINHKLVAAGSPNYYTAEEYLAVGLFTGLVLSTFLEVLYLLLTGKFSFSVIVIGGVLGTGLTLYQLYDRASTRLHVLSRRLPYALDLISLAMGAGATFTEAVRTIVRERDQDPLNVELKAVLAEIELGTTRRRALQNLAHRVPLEGMRSISASVIQAEELGTPLHDVLRDQATLLRLQRSVHAENAAAVASTRIMLPCLLIVMAVILAVFAPAILRMINGGLM